MVLEKYLITIKIFLAMSLANKSRPPGRLGLSGICGEDLAMTDTRIEQDLLGTLEVPAQARYGIHTAPGPGELPPPGPPRPRPSGPGLRRREAGRPAHQPGPGSLPGQRAKAEAMERACLELLAGDLTADLPVDALQGGAGTSTNLERQRSPGQPGPGAPGRAARHLRSRLSPGRPEPPPEHQRHLSHRPAHRGHPGAEGAGTAGPGPPGGLPGQGEGLRPHREGGPHRDAGRRAPDPGAGDGGLCRGPEPGPLAPGQVRGAPAGGEPGRHRRGHGPGRAQGLHLPGGGRAARHHGPGPGPGREPGGGHPERRCVRGGLRPAQGPGHEPHQDQRRPAPALQRPRGGPGRAAGCRRARPAAASCPAR